MSRRLDLVAIAKRGFIAKKGHLNAVNGGSQRMNQGGKFPPRSAVVVASPIEADSRQP